MSVCVLLLTTLCSPVSSYELNLTTSPLVFYSSASISPTTNLIASLFLLLVVFSQLAPPTSLVKEGV